MISQAKLNSLVKAVEAAFTTATDWVDAFRQILGLDGILRSSLSAAELTWLEREGNLYPQWQERIAKMRAAESQVVEIPAQRVITVRLPVPLHASLRSEAHDMKTSMNKLCISKLMQPIDPKYVPTDSKIPVNAV